MMMMMMIKLLMVTVTVTVMMTMKMVMTMITTIFWSFFLPLFAYGFHKEYRPPNVLQNGSFRFPLVFMIYTN